jgi:hypothetical protein
MLARLTPESPGDRVPEARASDGQGEPPQSAAASTSTVRKFDWQIALAILLVALVIIPRSILIARAHSETVDANYHRTRGLAYWTRSLASKDLEVQDPPVGQGLVTLPVLITNLMDGRDPDDVRLFDEPGRPERLAVLTAVWNSILFLPLIGVVFVWCRRLYGLQAAWLATAMLAIDPNFAAHIPLVTLDVVGVTGIVIACFLAWRYFERPTGARLVAMGVATGVAMMIKHLAVVLPPFIVVLATFWWVVKPWRDGTSWADWRSALPGRLRATFLAALLVVATIWSLTLFELCSPKSRLEPEPPPIDTADHQKVLAPKYKEMARKLQDALNFRSPWPAGIYLRAFRSGFSHGLYGHRGYLFGEVKTTGWWYYFPVVASYKVPIGIGVVLLLGLLSLGRTPPRWEELGLAVPLLVWAVFLLRARVNIGFRHFLPAYAFALAVSSRCVARGGLMWSAAAWLAVVAAGVHTATYHPDYLSYINFPRDKPYLAISDSNIDWGQGLKQARAWLDSHPQGARPVYLRYFGGIEGAGVGYYLDNRVIVLGDDDPLPTRGLLIISPPKLVIHTFAVENSVVPPAYKALKQIEPDAVIGHSLLVYDLDRIADQLPPQSTAAPAP